MATVFTVVYDVFSPEFEQAVFDQQHFRTVCCIAKPHDLASCIIGRFSHASAGQLDTDTAYRPHHWWPTEPKGIRRPIHVALTIRAYDPFKDHATDK